MVTRQEILALSERIRARFRPERIVLFGSHAEGRATDTSDVDLLIVLPFQGRPMEKTIEILSETSPSFAVDLLVRTPEQVRVRMALGDPFFQNILEKGEPLYVSAHHGVGG